MGGGVAKGGGCLCLCRHWAGWHWLIDRQAVVALTTLVPLSSYHTSHLLLHPLIYLLLCPAPPARSVNRFNSFEGWVGSESVGQDILISGRIDMNRAMEGDVVAGKFCCV